MPRVRESGALPPPFRRVLEVLGTGVTVEEVAASVRLPVFRVRAVLREAMVAGLVREETGVYRLTVKGAAALRRSDGPVPPAGGAE